MTFRFGSSAESNSGMRSQCARSILDVLGTSAAGEVRPICPRARTKAQDEPEKTFWSDWAKKSAPQDSHNKALAARLEAIACVAEGAPYVARGLLRAGRFDRLYENKETSHGVPAPNDARSCGSTCG